jgi:hypothetical protein
MSNQNFVPDETLSDVRAEVTKNPWRIAIASAVAVWLVVGIILAVSSGNWSTLGWTALWALLGGVLTGFIGTRKPTLPLWAYPVLVLVIAVALLLLASAIGL